MLSTEQLQQLIIKILNSELSVLELNLFIRYCASIATAYLFSRKKNARLSHEFMGADETQIQQLAIDSIADLFARDHQNKFTCLIRYYSPLLTVIEKIPDEALFLTRRLIVAHTKQYLVKTYANNDPAGAKIYRNLGLVPKRDDQVKLVEYEDQQYCFFWDKEQSFKFPESLNPGKPQIEWDIARQQLEASEYKTMSVPKIVRDFLSRLSQEDDYRHFIARSELFKLLNHTLGMKTISIDTGEYPTPNIHADHFAITESDQGKYLKIVEDGMRSEIEKKYVSNAKIGEGDALIYSTILNKYFQDLIMDGFAGKLPEYRLNSNFNDISDELWKVHRGRLEYLIKLGREQLKAYFENEFLKSPGMLIESR